MRREIACCDSDHDPAFNQLLCSVDRQRCSRDREKRDDVAGFDQPQLLEPFKIFQQLFYCDE